MDTQGILGTKPSSNEDESCEKAKYEHLAPYLPQDDGAQRLLEMVPYKGDKGTTILKMVALAQCIPDLPIMKLHSLVKDRQSKLKCIPAVVTTHPEHQAAKDLYYAFSRIRRKLGRVVKELKALEKEAWKGFERWEYRHILLEVYMGLHNLEGE
ncbi:MAG: hypothetical protein Q9198_010220 [Flavoplaca austrocitrina]